MRLERTYPALRDCYSFETGAAAPPCQTSKLYENLFELLRVRI
jgi:hypothetical protein